ncbi:MAG: UDP-N-acetylmuramoyl-tripeptide--D-alanyl-D-alanine ligase [Candidatus Gribaldobacteria bacterium]|nr:UDP-N-acetylmuramoyl-tripeptide--D-alanyl-D-alanine ligase [Candidatus Gribaldobacteria bacterium]
MEQIIKIIISIFWYLFFAKIFLFWLWLWQLKNYHLGRFSAHFEGQKIKKLMASWYRAKLPLATKKTILIADLWFLSQGAFFWLIFNQPDNLFRLLILLWLFFLPIISSVFILIFQIPTWLWQSYVMKKAKAKRKQFKNLTVIAITGSYGKTSTKDFLLAMLSEKFSVLSTEKNTNAEIGIAQTIINKLKPEHQILIAEVGAYQRGKIKQVCAILEPQIGVLTGINEQHLACFGSQENIIKAKFELIESLNEQGTAILNGDDEKLPITNYQFSNLQLKSKIFCSTKAKADIWAEDIKIEKEKVSFTALSKDNDKAQFEINLIGKQNIINVLMATAVAKTLGMTMAEIALACQKIRSHSLKQGINDLNILDYTYSANPASIMAHLEYLKTAWPQEHKIIVMPCLIELGKASKNIHYKIGQAIGQICDLAIITTQDRFKELRQGALEAGLAENKILLLEKPEQILAKIKTIARPNDIILLESRVPNGLLSLLNIV